ncbi:MAG: DUF2752 domain-containing protein [Chloroflexota bacterium]
MRLAAFERLVFTPVFATLLSQRRDGLILVGVGAIQVGLHLAGLPGWQCPIKAITGLPCPGCGLTEAVGDLLHGDWRGAMAAHAFAPLFLLAFILLLIVSVLPEAARQRTVAIIATCEQRTGLMAWVLFSLMVYWGFRLFGLV